MARVASSNGGVYVYAVVDGAEERNFGSLGLFGSEVYTVPADGISAVVSDMPEVDRLRPERRHLAAHQAILSRLVDENLNVLPVSFGTVAEGDDSIRKLLSRYRKELRTQLEKVSGRVEMGLRVVRDVPNVFEHYVKSNPELKAARDRVYDSKHEPSRDEKIELGQLFERVLSEEREACKEKVEKYLSGHCTEIKENRCRNEMEMLRLSCLIDKDRAGNFESILNEAIGEFEDSLVFEYNGPVPPYNFVDVRVKL